MNKALWGGRFKKGMHPLLKEFSYSLLVDHELLGAELEVSSVYARMLSKIGLITSKEAAQIMAGLEKIKKSWKPGDACRHFQEIEDIHTFIQQELEKNAGSAGKKIHTGRSRNDLVVTTTLIYTRGKLAQLETAIAAVQKSLVILAKKAGDLIIPGMTHLRKAQPILAAHHLLAYVEMLEGDRSRFQDAGKRMNVLPLGSAALAGSALPLDRKFLAKELGFDRISSNSLAATADRGWVAEILAGYSILWMHLSRLSEDMILWNNEAFGYIDLDDEFSTGSSLMPQKKNPDVFELLRGRAGVVFGQLQAILTLQKGLPLAYNRDLQEDKPGLFDAMRKTQIALAVLAPTLETITFNPKAMKKALEDDSIYSTDVLEYLIQKGIPFSTAHEIVGKIVRHAQDCGLGLKDMPLSDWKNFSSAFDKTVFHLLDPSASVSGKKTEGSTHPARVKREILKWERNLKK
ncbi:MAG: argininosuccinate lyase [Candidatus Omnitrophica bacterium]|nr:argininosuccinate lyase [Candidatus Omnitrophota bacterium]